MLIRFLIENFFSFGERKEFSMIPNKRLKTLLHHKYVENEFEILKTASIYGANGSGKSNLIKTLDLFQKFVTGKVPLLRLTETQFKFNDDSKNSNQIIAIDFIQDSTPFYYAIELTDDKVSKEELYTTDLIHEKYELVFDRKTSIDNKTEITFSKEFEEDEKSKVFKSVMLEDFVKPDKLVLKFLSNRDNPFLLYAKKAYKWFDETLQILTPASRPTALAHKIDVDKEFKDYATELMGSFNLGITDLIPKKTTIQDFFGNDDSKIVGELVNELKDSPNRMIGLRTNSGEEIIIANEDGEIIVKTLRIGHAGKGDKHVLFDLNEESDGTIRLLDFVPAFKNVISHKKVYIIDEIERSIHPLLIKELVQKFSEDEKTEGQLIFTTHESNLLDQNIFRTDEIWFTEKNRDGATDLYSLSDFKEHKTIDIKKGYLNGRYGSIPFLGNLKDLNWHNYDTTP